MELIDSGPYINVRKRTICGLSEMREIVVEGDNLSQMITFTMPDDFDGEDVLQKNVWVKYINADNFGDKVAAEEKRRDTVTEEIIGEDGEVLFRPGDKVVRFGWVVDSQVTQKAGKVQIAVEITGLNYKWSTMPATLTVEETVDISDTIMVPEIKWLEAYEKQLEYLVDVYRQQLRLDYLGYIAAIGEKCAGCRITEDGIVTGSFPAAATAAMPMMATFSLSADGDGESMEADATGTLPDIATIVGTGASSMVNRNEAYVAAMEGILTAENQMTGTYPDAATVSAAVEAALVSSGTAKTEAATADPTSEENPTEE
ncbi:hypothetical protein [Eubacterium barkeri]|uniref:Uncharacterized protein n=1 Tax=Eubacterium barkeri TaxID=1528 RepID=A0A1H3BKQ8_EUBBA|nr:hypothetical protein [Eubacterium barkeri]SDX42311.1 hypothetical protein SAMN04488579_102111 [Eubacterium barkeri]